MPTATPYEQTLIRTSAKCRPTAVDLGGPEGGRYWLILTDHPADHPDVRAAAIHARVAGSVGCTYNDAKVARLEVVAP